jgi:phosphatidylserine/phosphatidylglycerophosphate/cardiolipin synthase-like enzyme
LSFQIHFGGPDLPAKALRDLLQRRIEATPAGAAITWITYYFRDRGLAQALVAAHQRGVRVRVIIEARPRRRGANAAVIAILAGGLREDLRLHRTRLVNARLHAKIYAFSGPEPETFIGSFNPSGDTPEDPQVVAEIGDQDRGHNLLVAFRDPADAAALHDHALEVWKSRGISRFRPSQNRMLRLNSANVHFYPRLRIGIVEAELAKLEKGDVVRAAVSHLHHGQFTRRLMQAVGRGARVELVVHDTRRRVPQAVVTDLAAAGVAIQRYCHPEDLPMHGKFVLLERGGRRAAYVGSLNYNFNSQVLNQEILVRTEDAGLIDALQARFTEIARQAAALAAARF